MVIKDQDWKNYILSILSWAREEQLLGRNIDSEDVATQFGITEEEAERIREELEDMGEL